MTYVFVMTLLITGGFVGVIIGIALLTGLRRLARWCLIINMLITICLVASVAGMAIS
jgi:hypothetical protein